MSEEVNNQTESSTEVVPHDADVQIEEPVVEVGSEFVDAVTPESTEPSVTDPSGEVTPPVDPPVEEPIVQIERQKVWNVGAQKWVDAETGE
jgi:hypothetical protein